MGQILDDGPSLPYFLKTTPSKDTFEMSHGSVGVCARGLVR